ncbi:Transferrin receptor-like, ESAG6-like [Trypanosoma congolense IL3000]|uniref:Transferrin receptor-like, ESAG6-like n=1 Tax=Trypanosoma congolense (strain IL3000) TaxID=1068625 RepID=F9W3C1_TRYCI|nr:Transferrin receptor-like, ESAG6-like [Trypanosoma congolense IL3000]
MTQEVRLNWIMLCVTFILFTDSSQGRGRTKKAIPTAAGKTICTVSKSLKEVTPWTAYQIEKVKKQRDELEAKLFDWQINLSNTDYTKLCSNKDIILKKAQETLKNANNAIKELHKKAINASAFAGISAGRLDEFIMVFTRARAAEDTVIKGYCLGDAGMSATPSQLPECFTTEENEQNFGEQILAKIPGYSSEEISKELNLAETIAKLNYKSMAVYLKTEDQTNQGCRLITTISSGGVINGQQAEKLWWGGGILTIGKNFGGDLSKILNGREIESVEDYGAAWTNEPATAIVHFNNAREAFEKFTETRNQIAQSLKEVGNKIDMCISQRKAEEEPPAPGQTCFDKTTELEAKLQKAKALLARYKSEKGELDLLLPEREISNETTNPTPHIRGASNRINHNTFLGLLVTIL